MITQATSASPSLLLRTRYALEVAALKAAIFLVGGLSRGTIGWLARALGAVAYYTDFRGRKTALENLRCTFPDRTPAERSALARRSYQHFAFTFLDLFWAQNLTADNWGDYVDLVLEAPEATRHAEATSGIWITPHFGNFEWSALIQGLRGIHIQIIAQNFHNAALTPIFKKLREQTGHRIIPQDRAMLRLFKALKSGGHTALLSDLNVDLSQSPAVIDCFGLKTCVTTLHAVLAVRCQVPVIPVVVIRLEGGRYRMVATRPLSFSAEMPAWEITQRCWDAFEPFIREHPEQWLWMYKHWRYSPATAPAGDYPAYSHPKRKFDRILASQRRR